MDQNQQNQQSQPEEDQQSVPAQEPKTEEVVQPLQPQTTQSRDSGRKTLLLVTFIIATVTVLSILSLLLINKNTTGIARPKPIVAAPSPTAIPTISEVSVDSEIDEIDVSDPSADVEALQKEADSL